MNAAERASKAMRLSPRFTVTLPLCHLQNILERDVKCDGLPLSSRNPAKYWVFGIPDSTPCFMATDLSLFVYKLLVSKAQPRPQPRPH